MIIEMSKVNCIKTVGLFFSSHKTQNIKLYNSIFPSVLEENVPFQVNFHSNLLLYTPISVMSKLC